MCRLFGLTAGRESVAATFWLLGAPDNLRDQSQLNPDGTGLGTFDMQGQPVVEKQPLSAVHDPAFATEARDRRSRTFVAHVRRSSGTPVRLANTHPFTMAGRLFAHNGSVSDLDRLDAHLGTDLQRVTGDTDSERLFALITREAERADDLATGIREAVRWVVDELELVSINFILTEPQDLWALRYPAARELWLLDRRGQRKHLDHRSSMGTRVCSDDLGDRPSVVLASEPLDDNAWELLDPGELVHVDADLSITRTPVLPDPKEKP